LRGRRQTKVHEGFIVERLMVRLKAKKELDLKNRKISHQVFEANCER
jgi:hypothetical protein